MPKVSIICLCHNQAAFVKSAIDSVLIQSFDDWELIVVDDASRDGSGAFIESYVNTLDDARTSCLLLKENAGNCKAFNLAFRQAKGQYVLDLAADDCLMPDRLALGIAALDAKPDAAVHFGNALFVDHESRPIGQMYATGNLSEISGGDVYQKVVGQHYLSSASMMMRADVLRAMGGYDESLSYEDFDIIVRLARKHEFVFSPEFMVKKRILSSSMSAGQYDRASKMLPSTLQVCQKIYAMNRSKGDDLALMRRILYEGKKALFSAHYLLFFQFTYLFFKSLVRIRF